MDTTAEHIALSARVVMIYVPPDNKIPEILLVRERPQKSYGAEETWTAPGGGHEPREDKNNIKNTAVREFLEETGITLDPDGLNEEKCLILRGKSLKPLFVSHEVYVFLVLINDKKEPHPQDEDILAAQWFRLSELPSEANPVDGAPLSSSSWPQFRSLLSDKHSLQLLDAAGINEKRIEGIFRAWKKRRKSKATSA